MAIRFRGQRPWVSASKEAEVAATLRTACYRNNGSAAATASGVIDGVSSGCGEDCLRWARRAALLSLAIVATLIVSRAVDSQRGPPLEPWHTFVPDDAHAAAIENGLARMDGPEGHVSTK